MRRREAVAALIVGALILLALLAVFAIDLANTQARSRSDFEAQAHQRGRLVAGLIDNVFAAMGNANPKLQAVFGLPAADGFDHP